MSQLFKVASIKNINWNNSIVRASVDLELLPSGIILRDCLLKEGQYGWFLSSPSKKLKEPYTSEKTGKTHEYMDLAFFPKTVRDEINQVCCEAYNPDGNYGNQAAQTDVGEAHPLADKAGAVFTDADLPA